jgi:hypothetical protein
VSCRITVSRLSDDPTRRTKRTVRRALVDQTEHPNRSSPPAGAEQISARPATTHRAPSARRRTHVPRSGAPSQGVAAEEIWINQPDRVFVARDGRHELTTTILSADDVRDLVERMLKTTHRRIDVSTPFVDVMMPNGHRLHVVLDGITRGYSGSTSASSSRRRPGWPISSTLAPSPARPPSSSTPASSPASTSLSPAAPRPARRPS